MRALYKDNPTFSKGPFCPYLFEVRGFLGYPFGERTEVAYEEDVGARWHCLRDPPCSCLGDPPDRDEGALSLSACPCGCALTAGSGASPS